MNYARQMSNVRSQKINSKGQSDTRARAYRFSLRLIKVLDGLPRDVASQVILKQLLRSGTSIGANLVEGQSSSSRLEYKKFHEISFKSANETRYWLGLLRDSGRTAPETIDPLLNEAKELSNIIAAGVMKLKSR